MFTHLSMMVWITCSISDTSSLNRCPVFLGAGRKSSVAWNPENGERIGGGGYFPLGVWAGGIHTFLSPTPIASHAGRIDESR